MPLTDDQLEYMRQDLVSGMAWTYTIFGHACPFCKEIIDGANKFCPHCGKKLTKECPGCQVMVPVTDIFCSQCGHKFGKSSGDVKT